MKRFLLLLLFLFSGSAFSVTETMPAVVMAKWQADNCNTAACAAGPFDSSSAAATAYCAAYGGFNRLFSDNSFLCTNGRTSVVRQVAASGCPSGGGWVLNGALCTREVCAPGEVRGSDGVCSVPCPSGQIKNADGTCHTLCPTGTHPDVPDTGKCLNDCFGKQLMQADGTCKCEAKDQGIAGIAFGEGGKVCNNGCEVQFTGPQFCPGGLLAAVTGKTSSVTCYGKTSSNGNLCGTSANPNVPVTLIPAPTFKPADTTGTGPDGTTPDPKNTPSNSNDPVSCGSAGGSYIELNGVGKCISDSAISPADATAKVTTDKKTTSSTAPDGTKAEVTQTTQTASPTSTSSTSPSVTSVTTTTTTGNGTSTTTSTGTGTGAGGGGGGGGGKDQVGDCTLEPNAPFCREFTAPDSQEIYKKKEKTFDQVFKGFSDKITTSPIGSAAGGFFKVQTGSGSCPSWSVLVPVLNVQLDLGQYFCTPTAISMMDMVGAVLMFVAAFVGFRWAIL